MNISEKSNNNRLGVDIGGTFTDVVLETTSNHYSTKVLTNKENPEAAIIEGIEVVCLEAGIELSELTQEYMAQL